MKHQTLETMFHDGLRDIFYTERKILKALPKMERAAQSEELRAAFQRHFEETEGQVERLQRVFELIGKRAQAKTCHAIDGIIEEGEEVIETLKGSSAIDAALAASAQAVEHYEIARYGTLATWADTLGMTEAATLLEETLAEEMATDEALSVLAETSLNANAMAEAT